LTDAVVDGETGLLHAPHDVNDLQFALARLVQEPLLRKRLGMAARNRAIQHFDSIDVARDFAEYIFQRLLR
jgi:glycosyltransferase involved in cell wall biosynthesis